MRKLLVILDKININLLTIIFVILSILLGKFQLVIFYYIIAILHELFHLVACIIFKIKIENFNILPLGVSMQVNGIEKLHSLKQIIIYIAGPMSVFFDLLIADIFLKHNFISLIAYKQIVEISFAMAICNILPIYPLDGYKIMKSIFQIFIPYKKSLKLSIISSILFFSFFVFINTITFQLTITIFLLVEQIKNISNYKKIYRNFLIDKTLNKRLKKYKMINDYQMYKDVNNYKIENDKILNDYDIAMLELKNFV